MTEYLLVNLFKVYHAAGDRNFTSYIDKNEDEYDEGKNIKTDKLMQIETNKYKVLKDKCQ